MNLLMPWVPLACAIACGCIMEGKGRSSVWGACIGFVGGVFGVVLCWMLSPGKVSP